MAWRSLDITLQTFGLSSWHSQAEAFPHTVCLVFVFKPKPLGSHRCHLLVLVHRYRRLPPSPCRSYWTDISTKKGWGGQIDKQRTRDDIKRDILSQSSPRQATSGKILEPPGGGSFARSSSPQPAIQKSNCSRLLGLAPLERHV